MNIKPVLAGIGAIALISVAACGSRSGRHRRSGSYSDQRGLDPGG